jgi:hypothetical protein
MLKLRQHERECQQSGGPRKCRGTRKASLSKVLAGHDRYTGCERRQGRLRRFSRFVADGGPEVFYQFRELTGVGDLRDVTLTGLNRVRGYPCAGLHRWVINVLRLAGLSPRVW